MPVQMRYLGNFQNWYNTVLPAVRNPEVDRLGKCIAAAAFIHTEKQGLWNTVKASGSCRAAAIGLNAGSGLEEIHIGSSQKGSHHAEEELVAKTAAWGANFLTMYVDIEPCSPGRYKGHPAGCAALIAGHYGNGNLWYAFPEASYASGDLYRLLTDSEKQDQILKLRSIAAI
jgi:hypothetical protein